MMRADTRHRSIPNAFAHMFSGMTMARRPPRSNTYGFISYLTVLRKSSLRQLRSIFPSFIAYLPFEMVSNAATRAGKPSE
jgi:hypothetical protein